MFEGRLASVMTICLALAGGGAAAQPANPFDPGNGAARPRDRSPRISVELVRIQVNIESGFELFGSDEVAVAAQVDQFTLLSPVFESMDKGDVEAVPAHASCLWYPEDDPVLDGRWSCRGSGGPLPVTMTLTVVEIDLPLTGFCAPNSAGLRNDLKKLECHVQHSDAADIVGRHKLTYTAEDVLDKLPRVGDSLIESIPVNRCTTITTVEEGICGTGSLFDYWSGFYFLDLRITRLPDQVMDLPLDPGG